MDDLDSLIELCLHNSPMTQKKAAEYGPTRFRQLVHDLTAFLGANPQLFAMPEAEPDHERFYVSIQSVLELVRVGLLPMWEIDGRFEFSATFDKALTPSEFRALMSVGPNSRPN